MPRRKTIRDSEFPYHICARSNNRDWFSIPMNELWSLFSDYLFFISMAFEVEIHAFVLMSNHYHLIARTPLGNIDEAMEYFQRETSKQLARENGRINHIYGGPYRATLIKDLNHYNNVYKYVMRNPVTAGICKDVCEYPYSSLRSQIGFQKMTFPVLGNDELFEATEEFLKWLNKSYEEEVNDSIRKGLRKSTFVVTKSRKSGRQIVLPDL